MAEQRAKPATKKTSPGKTGSAAAVKPKATKVTAAATAKKTAAKKDTAPAVTKKTAASVPRKKAPAKKPVTTDTKPVTKKTSTRQTPEERYRMVQTAAYFIAERNGFGGCATEHWASAEIEIANKLRQ